MRIGAEDHPAAARKHFSCILMDYRLMGRYIDAAVTLRAGKAEHVVILIDRAAHRAQGIMAVGKHIGNRELCKARSPCRLNNPHKGNVMGSQFVKFNFQLFHIAGSIVFLQNAVGDGIFRRIASGYLPACLILNLCRRICTVRNNLRSV